MTAADDTPPLDPCEPERADATGVRPWTVHEVDVEVVRPLRLKYLRPGADAADVEYRTDEDGSARHFAARDEHGTVVGVGSMHFENRVAGVAPYLNPGMRLRGMAVEDDWRGRGVGADLIRAMVRVGCDAGMQEVWANARTANLGFYQRTRFKPVSSAFEIPQIGEHVVMARSLVKEARPDKPKKPKRSRKKRKGAPAEEE